MRRLSLFALLIGLVLWQQPGSAAGTLTVTSRETGTGVTRYTLAWTSTAGGAVSGNGFNVRPGRLLNLKCVPGATTPDNLYDVTLVDSDSVDLLEGRGANRLAASGAYLLWDPPFYFNGLSTLDLVIANAGASKNGTCYLEVQ